MSALPKVSEVSADGPWVSEKHGFLIQACDLGSDQEGWHLKQGGYQFAQNALPNTLKRFIHEVGQRDIKITITLEAKL